MSEHDDRLEMSDLYRTHGPRGFGETIRSEPMTNQPSGGGEGTADWIGRVRERVERIGVDGPIVWTNGTARRLLAQVDALAAQHTRDILQSTLKGYKAGESDDGKHWRTRAEAAEAQLAAKDARIAALEARTCHWAQEVDPSGDIYWDTQCGDAFICIDSTPKQNHMQFCPFCGGSIVYKLVTGEEPPKP